MNVFSFHGHFCRYRYIIITIPTLISRSKDTDPTTSLYTIQLHMTIVSLVKIISNRQIKLPDDENCIFFA